MAGNENSDLIITLSKNLKNEKTTNENLRIRNKEMSDSLGILKTELYRAKGLNKTSRTSANGNENKNSNSDSTPQKKQDFVLPKEGDQ